MQSRSHEYDLDLGAASWHKASYSGGDGGNCLEVAEGLTGIVPVRDSKRLAGPVLTFRATAWSAFLTQVKAG
ncbi:DUF397 domain-containing protein [Streptomyces sp. NPDC002018]|uniref:DUF397 domain-containing protein n=1 Tax=Streptomyces sp. NPDC002018 TaxID=3364629 RepID=UPI0036C474F0